MEVKALKDCSYNFDGSNVAPSYFKKDEIYDLNEKKALFLINSNYAVKLEPEPETVTSTTSTDILVENKMLDISSNKNKAKEKKGKKAKK